MITEISINNFKSLKKIENLEINMLTVFSGLNGLGKSSFIQILLLLRQSFKEESFSKGLFLKDSEGIGLGMVKDIFTQDSDVNQPMCFNIEFDYEEEISLKFKAKGNLEKDVFPLFSQDLNKINLADKSLFNNNFQYLGANRINPSLSYDTSSYFIDDLNSLGKEGEYAVHYLAQNQDKILENKVLEHNKAKSDTFIDNVNAWLSEISPGIKALATYIPDLETAKLTYQFETKDDYTNDFKPTQVGFGLTYVLPIIISLLKAEKGNIVIIENPESHLHPSGQSKIGHLCALAASSGIQVILESHSDHVINGIRIAIKNDKINNEDVSVYFLNRNNDTNEHYTNINEITINENGKMSDWPKGFMDEWDNQLNDLLSS